ncbi:MAG: hypothetical protein AB7F75_07720 [Planctomycetota bacterium]
MNNPLGGLIFKIIEQALEQDTIRRKGGGATPEVPPQTSPEVHKRQVLSRVQSKLMMARARQGLQKAPQEASPAGPSAVQKQDREPEPVMETLRPKKSPKPTRTPVSTFQERQSLKSLVLGQIILGPCKALEAPQD